MGGQPDILVVDDEIDNLELFSRVLRSVGKVTACANGDEALVKLRAQEFAVVVSDHLMPGLTGVELLERASRLRPHMHRILVSGYGDVDMLTDAINRGHIMHFLPKPVDPRELRSLVKEVVSDSKRITERSLVLAAEEDTRDRIVEALRTAGLRVAAPNDRTAGESKDEIVVWQAGVTDDTMDRVRRALEDETRSRRQRTTMGLGEIIGSSSAMAEVFERIEQVASTDATVLVRGETGTGKELVARVIHSMSERAEQPFVPVNCAAIPESLVESELFGHERGAYTGAVARKLGRFERADAGTLFIDEVGDMPMPVQVKLLRTLQERTFERVGGTETLHVDIRLIAATNLDLEHAITTGRFREDLFYRLNVVPIYLPPLRERTDDIPLLVESMLPTFERRLGKEGIRVSPEMMQRLKQYDWPGNVRELMNLLERVVALTPSGKAADFKDLKSRAPRKSIAALIPEKPNATLKEMVDAFERKIIVQALERQQGNRSRSARELGITRQGLSIKIKKHGL